MDKFPSCRGFHVSEEEAKKCQDILNKAYRKMRLTKQEIDFIERKMRSLEYHHFRGAGM